MVHARLQHVGVLFSFIEHFALGNVTERVAPCPGCAGHRQRGALDLFAVDQRAAATAKPMTIVFELRHSGSGEGCTQGVFLVESRIGSERVLGLQMYGLE